MLGLYCLSHGIDRAARDISAGEEITADYVIVEGIRPARVQRGAAEPDTVAKKAKIAAFERSLVIDKDYDELGPDTHHPDGL